MSWRSSCRRTASMPGHDPHWSLVFSPASAHQRLQKYMFLSLFMQPRGDRPICSVQPGGRHIENSYCQLRNSLGRVCRIDLGLIKADCDGIDGARDLSFKFREMFDWIWKKTAELPKKQRAYGRESCDLLTLLDILADQDIKNPRCGVNITVLTVAAVVFHSVQPSSNETKAGSGYGSVRMPWCSCK